MHSCAATLVSVTAIATCDNPRRSTFFTMRLDPSIRPSIHPPMCGVYYEYCTQCFLHIWEQLHHAVVKANSTEYGPFSQVVPLSTPLYRLDTDRVWRFRQYAPCLPFVSPFYRVIAQEYHIWDTQKRSSSPSSRNGLLLCPLLGGLHRQQAVSFRQVHYSRPINQLDP